MSLANSLIPSSSRPLGLRMRRDLIVRRQRYDGEPCWVVKDPCALRYLRLSDQEYTVLQALDGRASLDDVLRVLRERYPRDHVRTEDVHRFLGRLYEQGIVFSQAAGQAKQLGKRAFRQRLRSVLSRSANILSIRFRGVDPTPVLDALYPLVRWCFTPWAFALAVALMAAAASLVIIQFDTFLAKLPTADAFFTPWTALWLLAAMALLKAIHELGHALTCKHFGGRCHEIGVMFLLFTPCLYCNVSDSWMLPNKWHRVAIGAGGMIVEMAIASMCTFLWWYSQPGLLHQICLSMMIVGSVTTLLFNANPLLKFDGYYILCDTLEMPGLAARARSRLGKWLASIVLGVKASHAERQRERRPQLLLGYAIAATVYRVMMVVSIACALYLASKAWHLESLVVLVLGGSLSLGGGMSLRRFWRTWLAPGQSRLINKARAQKSFVVGLVSGVLALFTPIPDHVVCPVESRPRDGHWVYVRVPGQLDQVLVSLGDTVREGQPLVKLVSPEAELAAIAARARLERQALRLATLRRQRAEGDRKAVLSLEQATAELDHLRDEVERREDDLRRLTIQAVRPGTLLPPPLVTKQRNDTSRLGGWYGTPLDPMNHGCRLDEGDVLALIGDPHDLEAVLSIDEVGTGLIRPGQRVTVQWDGWPGKRWTSRIKEVSRRDIRTASRSMSNKSGGEVATTIDQSGRAVPLETIYLATAPIHVDDELPIGLRGLARVNVGYRSVLQRVWRFLEVTFHFGLGA